MTRGRRWKAPEWAGGGYLQASFAHRFRRGGRDAGGCLLEGPTRCVGGPTRRRGGGRHDLCGARTSTRAPDPALRVIRRRGVAGGLRRTDGETTERERDPGGGS